MTPATTLPPLHLRPLTTEEVATEPPCQHRHRNGRRCTTYARYQVTPAGRPPRTLCHQHAQEAHVAAGLGRNIPDHESPDGRPTFYRKAR